MNWIIKVQYNGRVEYIGARGLTENKKHADKFVFEVANRQATALCSGDCQASAVQAE